MAGFLIVDRTFSARTLFGLAVGLSLIADVILYALGQRPAGRLDGVYGFVTLMSPLAVAFGVVRIGARDREFDILLVIASGVGLGYLVLVAVGVYVTTSDLLATAVASAAAFVLTGVLALLGGVLGAHVTRRRTLRRQHPPRASD